MFACLFFLAPLFLAPTLEDLPNPFSYAENFYFQPDTRTFSHTDQRTLEKIGNDRDRRGYSFKHQPIPRKKAIRFPGTTLFLFEDSRTIYASYHFFHVLEHIVGDWSFYGDQHFEDVRLIVLGSGGEKDWVYDGKVSPVIWEGPNEINKHLFKALFPNAEVLTWLKFLDRYKTRPICFERALCSDRSLSFLHSENLQLKRMLGYARHFFSKEALQRLADRVHAYAQTQFHPSDAIRVTYLKRQPPRYLAPHIEEELLSAIAHLPNVSLCVKDFIHLSFQEQMQIIGNTDVLISVHGNGLSHVLFLPPTAKVIEIFPPSTHTLDYRIYAEARELDYTALISDIGVISREESYRLNMRGNFHGTIESLDIQPILAKIGSSL